MPPWGDLTSKVITGEYYGHAPIIEALVELRVVPDPALSLDDLLAMMNDDVSYGAPETLVGVQAEFQVLASEVQATASSAPSRPTPST